VKPKVTNHLIALSSAAVLAVYSAGYLRTRAAAARIAGAADRPRPVIAAPPVAGAAPAVAQPIATAGAAAPPATAPAPDTGTKSAVRAKRAASPKAPAPPVSAAATAATPLAIAALVAAPAADDPKPASAVPSAPPAPTVTATAVTAPPPSAPAPAAVPAAPVYKDGTYTGWGTSRHGDIQATVVIEGGKILSATISQCLTRYSCSVIEKLPPQVAARQSPEVDYVSGATQSTNAFYYAVVDALSKAK
jgi:uncharacterized protein with FMN-binding domain